MVASSSWAFLRFLHLLRLLHQAGDLVLHHGVILLDFSGI
jgi:hypothetical protein